MHPPPKRIEPSFFQVLECWQDLDLENIVNNKSVKHTHVKRKWCEKDSGVPDNLSKRGQIVLSTIKVKSIEINLSMNETATHLDEERKRQNLTVTQHWKKWVKQNKIM